MVRATDYLDSDGVMKPYSESPNIVKGSQNFLCDQLSDKSEIESFETYYPHYRSTIHTTENGLVSSHMYGNFDKRKFIILDPLRNQIDKANIITNKCDRILLDFIIKFNNLGIQKEDFVNEIGEIKQDAAYKLTSLIGINEIKKTVTSFNDTLKQMEESKTLPTPEEFINSDDLDLYEQYNLCNGLQK